MNEEGGPGIAPEPVRLSGREMTRQRKALQSFAERHERKERERSQSAADEQRLMDEMVRQSIEKYGA